MKESAYLRAVRARLEPILKEMAMEHALKIEEGREKLSQKPKHIRDRALRRVARAETQLVKLSTKTTLCPEEAELLAPYKARFLGI